MLYFTSTVNLMRYSMKSPHFVSACKSVSAMLTFTLMVMLTMSSTAWAQSTPQKLGPPQKQNESAMSEKEAVRKVIDDLFDAMRAGDGEKVSSLFVEGAILQSAMTDREGNPRLGNTPMSKFAEAVGQPHDQVWDERIWNVDIKIDGRLASAWMNFAFYLGDTFSHCGVNSVQLFKGSEGWKMMYLADTRQKATCKIPEEIKSAGN